MTSDKTDAVINVDEYPWNAHRLRLMSEVQPFHRTSSGNQFDISHLRKATPASNSAGGRYPRAECNRLVLYTSSMNAPILVLASS
jgi:hypothetical protein